MSTNIYTTDGDLTYTPAPYEQVKELLITAENLGNAYIELPGRSGNSYFIKIRNVTVIEEKLAKNREEKK